ncbi:MAG: cytochrome C oxidase subunit IV family protein [Campylobacterota bacterium]|nr:cytochrome C oxidase subunit IV family protein [Campylobacterota bacterium]
MKYIWITLVVLTIFAFLVGYLEFIDATLVAILLVTTFIKGQLVIDYFMGLKNVSLSYRLIPIVWLLFIISMVALAYYFPIEIT